MLASTLVLAPGVGVAAQAAAASLTRPPESVQPLDLIAQNAVPPSDAPDTPPSSHHGSSGGGGNGGQTD
jgi:hypothetical protein